MQVLIHLSSPCCCGEELCSAHPEFVMWRRNKGHISRHPDKEPLHIIKGMVVNVIHLPEGQTARMWQPDQVIWCCTEKQVWFCVSSTHLILFQISAVQAPFPDKLKIHMCMGGKWERTSSKRLNFRQRFETWSYFTWNTFSSIAGKRALWNETQPAWGFVLSIKFRSCFSEKMQTWVRIVNVRSGVEFF